MGKSGSGNVGFVSLVLSRKATLSMTTVNRVDVVERFWVSRGRCGTPKNSEDLGNISAVSGVPQPLLILFETPPDSV